MVLITIFAHSLTFFLPFLFILHLSCGIFLYIVSMSSLSDIWFVIFSVGYLFILLIVEETTISLCCLRNLVNFIWLCILEFTWGSLFWYLGLWICFYVSIIQLWFLYLCNVFWNQEMRYFDLCFQDYFVYVESLVVPYIFLDLFFPFLWKWC